MEKVENMIEAYLKQAASKVQDIDHEKEIDDRFRDLVDVLEEKEVEF